MTSSGFPFTFSSLPIAERAVMYFVMLLSSRLSGFSCVKSVDIGGNDVIMKSLSADEYLNHKISFNAFFF